MQLIALKNKKDKFHIITKGLVHFQWVIIEVFLVFILSSSKNNVTIKITI